jgi:hypothetical protein
MPVLKQHDKRIRILFVCFADSSHSQSWIDLLKDSDFDIRVFAYDVTSNGKYPPLEWHHPTYTLIKPQNRINDVHVKWVLPNVRWLRPVINRASGQFDLVTRWLRLTIQTWKPDIVHSLSIEPAGTLTAKALNRVPRTQRPIWIVSSWGSDINLGIHDSEARQRIQSILQNCDGFIADCRRDIRQAIETGLHPRKVAFNEAVPVTGGLDVESLSVTKLSCEQRNLIVIPKAYEEAVNKTLPVLEALSLAEDVVCNYDIHLLMCSHDVRMWLRTLPESIRSRCYCRDTVPHRELLDALRRCRVMVATSLSDGTPNVMLEAMAVGALPLMSPLESIKEWIEDGYNGLLAHALHPNQIAEALRRALTDDALCINAAAINERIVAERANRKCLRPRILEYYQGLMHKNI